MLRFEERDDVTVQNPPAGEVVLFYTDGAFRVKDETGDVVTIATNENIEVTEDAKPRVYAALFNQSGTSAPVATLLDSTLSGTLVWTYTGVGVYTGTLTGAFTADLTFIPPGTITAVDGSVAGHYTITRTSANVIVLRTFNTSFVAANALLIATPIEFKVYVPLI